MSYKSWRPSSRRDRRQQSRRSRSRGPTSSGSDRILLAVAGLFVAILLGVLVVVALNSG